MVPDNEVTNQEGPTDRDNNTIGPGTMGVARPENPGEGCRSVAALGMTDSLSNPAVAQNSPLVPAQFPLHVEGNFGSMSIREHTPQRLQGIHSVPGEVGAITSDLQP